MARDAFGHLILKTLLIAFRYVEGSHSGANLGRYYVQILEEMQILH